MIFMQRLEELQHNYNPEDKTMQSYFISILITCVEPIVIFGEGENWEYEYQWVCEEPTQEYLQIKAYQELPVTRTQTVDLFNRFPVSEVSGE